MMRMSIAALALVAGLLTVVGSGCRSRDDGPLAMDRPPSRSPSEGMKGIQLTNIRIGDTRWVLHADSASVFREKKRVEAQDVEIDFFEEDEHVSTLTADTGILQQVTDDLEARGNVIVESREGGILKTEVLYWDHQNALIHTDQYVEITKGDNVLTGVGLEADPGLDRIDIKEAVQGEIRDDDELVEAEQG
jgi:LPS export ABC transporter protein LptC